MQVPKRKPGVYTNQESDPHVTSRKLTDLKNELVHLKTVARPQAVAETKRLAEMGDFSENAEYQIAKGRLRGINNRIDALTDQIDRAIIIHPIYDGTVVAIGHTVTVNIDGVEKKYTILGPTESDPQANIISYQSPLGAALVGKKIGETFRQRIGHKEMEFCIITIST